MKILFFVLNVALWPVVFFHHKLRTTRIFLRAKLPKDAKVLDIGSGSNPWFRSNVLFEKYPDDDTERGGSLVRDGRKIVFGDAEDLPFADKEFDFVYCSHVAEHIEDIEAFFREIQRVGKAGYIETPNYLFEQTIGSTTHTWALYVEDDGSLHAERKWIAGAPARCYHNFHAALVKYPLLAFAFLYVPCLQTMEFWWKDSFNFATHPAPEPSLPTRSQLKE